MNNNNEEQRPGEEIEGADGEGTRGGSLVSPEAIIMLVLASSVDISEFLVKFIPVAGPIIAIIIDIIALVFIGGWMWFRSGTVKMTKKTAATLAKAAKWAKKMKWLRPICIIIEHIPIVGSLPLWIIVVYSELTKT